MKLVAVSKANVVVRVAKKEKRKSKQEGRILTVAKILFFVDINMAVIEI